MKKQRNLKSWDQQNYLVRLVIIGFCYTGKPRHNELGYNEVPVLTRQVPGPVFFYCVVQWIEQPFTTSSDIARFRL